MIRIYSLLVLFYDIVYLGVFTCVSIVRSLLRILFPPRSKSIADEVAVVSQSEENLLHVNFDRNSSLSRSSVPVGELDRRLPCN